MIQFDASPKHEELSAVERETILRAVANIQLVERLSDEAVGDILGCSAATWNLVKRSRYVGNSEKYLKRAYAWVAERESNRVVATAGYVATSVGERILKTCEYIASVRGMGIVELPTGWGKTEVGRECARRRGEKTALIQVGECGTSKAALLREMGRHLGVGKADLRGSFEVLWAAVGRVLEGAYQGGLGQPWMFLFDEARTLTPRALNMIRNFHDDPRCGLVVVILDTLDFNSRFSGERSIPGGYDQLLSRFDSAYRVGNHTPFPAADAVLVAQAIVASLGFRGDLPAQSRRYLADLAARDGALRNVCKRLRAAAHLADLDDREPRFDPADLEEAKVLLDEVPTDGPPAARPRKATAGQAFAQARASA
jgi:DNA transposition AAA+ family ATPase